MASRITQAVRFMSTVHASVSTLKASSPRQIVHRTVFHPKYFPQLLVVWSLMSVFAGYYTMGRLRRDAERRELEHYSESVRQRSETL